MNQPGLRTRICSLIAPAAFLARMQDGIGTDAAKFTPRNPQQRHLVKRFPALNTSLTSAFTTDELKTAFQVDGVDQVNKLLQDNGFEAALRPSPLPGAIAAGGILKLDVNWKIQGSKGGFATDPRVVGTNVPQRIQAAELRGIEAVTVVATDPNYPVAMLSVAGRDLHFALMAGAVGGDLEGMDLFGTLADVATKAAWQGDRLGYTGVKFPAINADAKPSLDWMLGLGIGDGFSLDQAVQHTKIKLDHLGASVHDGAAGLARRGAPPRDRLLEINGPLAVVCLHGNHAKRLTPLLAAVFGPDTWIKA